MSQANPSDTPSQAKVEEGTFLKSEGVPTENTSLYGDFFQETSDGSISIGPKTQKSGLEVGTTILGYIVPIALVITIACSIHVYMRTRDDASAFAQNYSFICPWFNYDVTLTGEEKACKTTKTIATEYTSKRVALEKDIIDQYTKYIPVKTSKNIFDASPEKKFIRDTYLGKSQIDKIMKQFETVTDQAKSKAKGGIDNIQCNGITITNGINLTTQCTIYGSDLGNDDANGSFLGSARIEALRFIDTLSDTAQSQFVLINPPTSMSVEKATPTGKDELNTEFSTRTTLPIQVKYVPNTTQP